MKYALLKKINEFRTERKQLNERDIIEFSGYAAVFSNEDKGGDIIVPGAFKKSIKAKLPKVLWQHNPWEPVGAVTECREDEKGLYVKGQLPLTDSLVSGRLVPQLEVNGLDSLSIGYWPEVVEYDFDNDVRYLKEIDLLEISFVTFPMNERAKVELEKSLRISNVYTDDDAEMVSEEYEFNHCEAVKRMRDKTERKDIDVTFCDVIDGEIKQVPRAFIQVKAGLNGLNDIFSGVTEKAKQDSRLYLDKKSDTIKSMSDDIEKMNRKELEMLPLSTVNKAVEKGKITKSAAKAFTSAIVNGAEDGESDKKGNKDSDLKKEEMEKITKELDEFKKIGGEK